MRWEPLNYFLPLCVNWLVILYSKLDFNLTRVPRHLVSCLPRSGHTSSVPYGDGALPPLLRKFGVVFRSPTKPCPVERTGHHFLIIPLSLGEDLFHTVEVLSRQRSKRVSSRSIFIFIVLYQSKRFLLIPSLFFFSFSYSYWNWNPCFSLSSSVLFFWCRHQQEIVVTWSLASYYTKRKLYVTE